MTQKLSSAAVVIGTLRVKQVGEKLEHFNTFSQQFNKFNNTGAQMIDSVYHITFKLFCYPVFRVETSRFCQIYVTLLWVLFHNDTKICKPLVVYQF